MNTNVSREVPGMFEGPLRPLLIRLAMPILLGMIVQLLYNVVDTIFISLIDKSDPSYIGGTGLVFPAVFITIATASGLMTGVGSVVARAIGERNEKALNKAAESALVLGFVLGLVVLLTGWLLAEPLVQALGAQGDYYLHGLNYLRYMIPFGALMIVVHSIAGIFQGEGKMQRIMTAMFVGTAANLLLDPLFIFVFKLDVRGAALASVTGQSFAGVYLLTALNSHANTIKLEWKLSNISPALMGKIAAIGIPMAAAQMAMALSMFFYNRIIIDIDAAAMTAFALVGRFDQAVLMPIFALSSAMITVVGQNVGRNNFQRVRKAWRTAIMLAGSLVLALATAHVFIAPLLYKVFSDVPEVVSYCVQQVRILEFSFLFATIGIIGRAVFQAIGYPLPALALTVFRTLALGLPLSALYAYTFDMGIRGVYFGVLTGNILTAGVGIMWIKGTLNRLENGKLKAAATTP
ncbi:MAG: MATE family efflux transporter [Chitinivibrionales bacterium]|nr:MATE family efflux transporter [Chitinivibrionales bacterium]MBD3357237.1 MATE family efflux transporter [Chitinivibrionales bacterium]